MKQWQERILQLDDYAALVIWSKHLATSPVNFIKSNSFMLQVVNFVCCQCLPVLDEFSIDFCSLLFSLGNAPDQPSLDYE